MGRGERRHRGTPSGVGDVGGVEGKGKSGVRPDCRGARSKDKNKADQRGGGHSTVQDCRTQDLKKTREKELAPRVRKGFDRLGTVNKKEMEKNWREETGTWRRG